jgi:hypothetical protein
LFVVSKADISVLKRSSPLILRERQFAATGSEVTTRTFFLLLQTSMREKEKWRTLAGEQTTSVPCITKAEFVRASKQVLLVSILSRLFVVIWAIIAKSLGTEYDTSGSILLKKPSLDHDDGTQESWKTMILSPFTSWDAVYFISIAERGYVYEQEFAFLPTYPFLLRLLGDVGKQISNIS